LVFAGETEDGEASGPLLFELALFGAGYPAPSEIRPPGNLRTVAITLQEALRRVVGEGDELNAELVVDEERFSIAIGGAGVAVRYRSAPDAPLSISTSYEARIAAGDGEMAPSAFAARHVAIERGTRTAAKRLLALLARAFGT